jgi:hypothetical protein
MTAPIQPSTRNPSNATSILNSKTGGIDGLIASQNSASVLPPEKKGRRSKGSKIIAKQVEEKKPEIVLSNIVLHLKCSLNELYEYNNQYEKMVKDPLKYDPYLPIEIKSYNDTSDIIGKTMNYMEYDMTKQQFGGGGGSSLKHNDGDGINYGDSHDYNMNGSIKEENMHNIGMMLNESPAAVSAATGILSKRDGDDISRQLQLQQGIDGYHGIPICSVCMNMNKIDSETENDTLVCGNKYKQNQGKGYQVSDSFFDSEDTDISVKEINTKLKELKIDLYKNSLQRDHKSACFWCTYDYDNMTCYIPKYVMDGVIYGYGSFCRPECAVAYLMKENIDDSTKYERYHLLNQIYSKVYNCKKNIKPAPNPYYTLDRYYGNMSIQQYRKLLKTEHLLLVVDKPLTRILPELHEDNEDVVLKVFGVQKQMNNSSNSSSVFKVKKQSEKQQGPSKSAILKSKFSVAM